jgi:Tfp pilus assembly protein PilZ
MNTMMIVVIARDADTQNIIASSLKSEGANVTVLSALGDLPAVLKDIPVNGILLELITSTRSTSQEKQDTNDLIQFYCCARFKFVDNQVRILGHGMTLEQFVSDCRVAKPRTIRKNVRKVRHIALLLSADDEFTSAEKTVTIDISDEGCFVFSSEEWGIGDRVWLRLLDNDCVLTGTVRSWQPWGNNKKMPGIGIQLDFSENIFE